MPLMLCDEVDLLALNRLLVALAHPFKAPAPRPVVRSPIYRSTPIPPPAALPAPIPRHRLTPALPPLPVEPYEEDPERWDGLS